VRGERELHQSLPATATSSVRDASLPCHNGILLSNELSSSHHSLSELELVLLIDLLSLNQVITQPLTKPWYSKA
jgi:hypothetical protein